MLSAATRDGYVFGGWYETADFTGDRVDFIRYGETRGYMLYAKWVKVLMSEENWLNSSGAPIEITHASKPNNFAINGVHYNASSGTDAKPVIYSSTEDGNGGRYMKITATGVTSFLNATGSGASGSYHLKYFEHPEMSFEFTYGLSVKEISEDGEVIYYPLASTTLRLQTPSSEGYGNCTFLSISKNGTAALAGSSKVIATLTEENPTATFRLNLDFVTGTVTAYDETYAVIDSAALTFPTNMTAANKPTTWLEWQKVASNYYFYGELSAPSGTTTYGAIFDGIKVYDGNAFVNFAKVLPKSNELTLDAGEGTLPEGAPTEYDKKNGTDITAVVPVREGYAFDGWYRTSDFSGERVYSIGIDETEPVTLYAKWALPMYTIVYNHNTGAEPATSREEYDTELGLVLPTPTREGYVFGGWYTTESFDGGTRVEKIEIGDTAAYELYARWFAVILETNLDTSSLDLTAQSKTQDGVTFNAPKERCTIKSIDDGSGKYVQMGVSDYTTTDGEYTSESKSIDAIVAVTSNEHNLTQMAETTLSLQFDFVYTEGTRLANATIAIATSGSAYGSLSIGRLDGTTGEIKLTGSSKVIGDLMDDEGNAINGGRVTVRLVVDFASETATAYDENGEILDSITVNAPSTGGCTDLLDWQKKATNYLFYSWIDNPKKANKDGINAYVGYDNFLIVDGNIYS